MFTSGHWEGGRDIPALYFPCRTDDDAGLHLEVNMLRLSIAVRAAVIGLIALIPLSTSSYPQEQKPPEIFITFVNAGFIVGVSGGSGTLVYQGKRYPLNIGGVSLGATFGASKAELAGTVLNLTKPSDISGTYGATEAGYAIVSGRKTARLKNTKGVVLVLRGRQVGLEVQLDLSGLQVALK
jgi:hypothetical protein